MPGLTSLNVTEAPIDHAELERAISSCAASHAALGAHLRSIAGVDPSGSSVLPDWSVGHVLTHIARNGDSHLDMLAGNPQYPSVESRNHDIDVGAVRAWSELVDDVERSGASADAAFDSHADWTGTALTMGGERPLTLLPLLRQREVEVHRADLGLGYGFGDMPADYVRRDLRLMEMLWLARKPMGMTLLPDDALATDPSTRLAWLMGRATIGDLGPAGLF